MGHMQRYQKGPRSINKPSVEELMNNEYEEDILWEPSREQINRQHYVGIQIVEFKHLT